MGICGVSNFGLQSFNILAVLDTTASEGLETEKVKSKS